MLESMNPDLVVHQGSPTKHPEARLETIRAAGELRIPFTSGILVGIGETPEERIAALEALAELHARARAPAGGDPAELRSASALLRRRAGARSPTRRSAREREGGEAAPLPAWATPIALDDMRSAGTRVPAAACQTSGSRSRPNLSDWWLPLVEEGATDLGGLSANGDHISPEHPFPSVHRMRKRLAPLGYALTERLCVVPAVHGSAVARAGRARS